MVRVVTNENTMSSFSPGFFLYKDGTIFLDRKAQTVFHTADRSISLSAFLCLLDDPSRVLFHDILEKDALGDVVIINASLEKNDGIRRVLIQGSVIERNAQGEAASFSGYCVEVKNEFSVPRIYDTAEIGLWEWDSVSGKCMFCKGYHRMLGYDWPYERLPDTFEGWKELVHPDDIEAVIFQEKLSRSPGVGDKFECFVRLRHKSGEYIWTIGKGFVAQRDHHGRAISIRGTNQNIDIVQRNYERAMEKNIRDALTGCYNRGFFKEYWKRLRDECRFPISFLYIDICGLKMINDLLGHNVGDTTILQVISIVESVIQMQKYIIRMGGDEFLVILPECSMELLVECEKNLNKYMRVKNRINDLPVLFSVGASSLYNKDESWNEAVGLAERNMQKNKEASRQQDLLLVVSYIEAKTGKKVAYKDSRLL